MPAHNDHNGLGVTMGAVDNPAGTAFALGFIYAQGMFKGGVITGAQGSNQNPLIYSKDPSKTQWYLPVTASLGVRHGLTDNLYGTASVVGNYTFTTNKADSLTNQWNLGVAIGADYYLTDSLYITGNITPFLYSQFKSLDPNSFSGKQVTTKMYSIFSSGYLGLTYNFNL